MKPFVNLTDLIYVKKRQRLIICCLVAISISSICLYANAQQSKRPFFFNQPPTKRQNDDYKAESLRQPPHFDGVPDYTGQSKFLSGTVYRHQNGSITYNVYYVAKEDARQVLEWYQTVLKMNGWDFDANSDTISGTTKSGNSCHIVVQPSRRRDGKTQIIIVYNLPH